MGIDCGLRLLSLKEIDQFFAVLSEKNPSPKTELRYTNTYTLLVAVVLSAQATDIGVNKATKSLFEQITTPQEMLAFGEASLLEAIKTIGLYKSKARHVIGLSQRLVNDFKGEVPKDRASLESLPGVGRKTANVVLNVAFGEPTIAVDTHIFRVSNRVGLAFGKTPFLVEDGLQESIPQKWRQHAHHWIILHGRYICKAKKPRCGACPVAHICTYTKKTGEE